MKRTGGLSHDPGAAGHAFDAAGDDLKVTLDVDHGVIDLPTTTGLTFDTGDVSVLTSCRMFAPAIGIPAALLASVFLAFVHDVEHWLWHDLPHHLDERRRVLGRLVHDPARADDLALQVAAMRLNLESRLAQRVLWPLGDGPYASEHDLYALARERVDWPRWITPRGPNRFLNARSFASTCASRLVASASR